MQEPVEHDNELVEVGKLRRRIKELEDREEELLKQLHMEEALHVHMLDALPMKIFIEDEQGRIRYANYQACERNITKKEIVGKTIFDLFPEHIAQKIRKNDLEVWRTKQFIVTEQRVGTEEEPVYTLSGKKIIEIDGKEEYLLGFVLDITYRVKAEQKLRESEERFRKLVDQAVDSFFLIDIDGKIVDVNTAACELLGYSRAELLAMTMKDITSLSEIQLEEIYKQCIQNRSFNIEHMIICKDYTSFPVDTNMGVIDIGKQTLYLALCRDIRDKKKAEERIQYMAYHDALTGLPNRWFLYTFIDNYLSHEWNSEKMFAILLLDLDFFKVINDSLGHQAGDLLLQKVSKRLEHVIRNEDTLTRLGGDEFIIFLPNLVKKEDAVAISNRIRKAMEEPFNLQGQQFTITTSVGISFYPTDGKDLDTLIKHADIAMYDSKEQGRINKHLSFSGSSNDGFDNR